MARIRLLLLAVVCWLCFTPTAHAIRPPSPAELQLKEETPCQQQPAYGLVVAVDAEGRTGLLCVNNPLRYTDPTGHDYVGDVGSMFVGYYQAGAGLVTGTAFMVAHPITTAQGIGTAVAHPVNTVSAIGSGIAKDWNSGAEGQGRVVGGALLAIGSVLAPGAEAGNLSKVGEVANAGEKAAAAAESPTITAGELAGKSAAEIRQLAEDKGLNPHPTRPDKWMDPATGKERLRLDPGHVDKTTGQPFNDPNAAVPHAHGYGPEGSKNPIVNPENGNKHFPTTPSTPQNP